MTELLQLNVKSEIDIHNQLKYLADNIRDLKDLLKNPPTLDSINEDIKKQLVLLTSIHYFPYGDLETLRFEI